MNKENIVIIKDKIYITSKEEINVGDWITDTYKVFQYKDDCSLLGKRKVTMTNDSDLDIPQLKQEDVDYILTGKKLLFPEQEILIRRYELLEQIRQERDARNKTNN